LVNIHGYESGIAQGIAPGSSIESVRDLVVAQAKRLGITEISPKHGATFSTHPDTLGRHLGLDAQASAPIEYDIFDSIYNAGEMLALMSWSSEPGCAGWAPAALEAAKKFHRRVRTCATTDCSTAGRHRDTSLRSCDARARTDFWLPAQGACRSGLRPRTGAGVDGGRAPPRRRAG
jgi:hypothetical protein